MVVCVCVAGLALADVKPAVGDVNDKLIVWLCDPELASVPTVTVWL